MKLQGNRDSIKLYRVLTPKPGAPPPRDTNTIFRTYRLIYREALPVLLANNDADVTILTFSDEKFPECYSLYANWMPVSLNTSFFALGGNLTVKIDVEGHRDVPIYVKRLFKEMAGCKNIKNLTIKLSPGVRVLHTLLDSWAEVKEVELSGLVSAFKEAKLASDGKVRLEFEHGRHLQEGEDIREKLRKALAR
jgi:hypothetical protein